MLKDIIVLGLVIFLISRILNRYILPIFRVTNAANDNIRRMQEQMKAQMQEMQQRANNQAPNNSHTSSQSRNTTQEGDYIDYEEIK